MIGLRRQGWWSSVCLAAVLAGTAAAEEVAVNGQALPPQPVEQTSAVAEPQAVLNAAGNDAQAAWTTGGVAPISYEWTPVPGTAAQTYAPAAPASNRLFGLIAPSDTCFADFVSPITNPLFFEDPRTLSEVRTIFANHWIPDSNPVFNGGNAQYLAVQARVALTERLSFIATKDGYIWLDSNNEAVIPDNDGWADVAAGLKYNLVRDPQQGHRFNWSGKCGGGGREFTVWSLGFTEGKKCRWPAAGIC